jgi:hypothetical protein
LPAALKKILDEPFTDPAKTGAFHDFLDAFHATGWFYNAVGALQLLVAVLLYSQRLALAGALIALPILSAITAFCWSTRVYPTATVATLMWLATLSLVVWDVERWRGVFVEPAPSTPPAAPPIDLRPWQWCGAVIASLYLGASVVHGGVYRPRGMDTGDPVFFVLPAIALCPLITLLVTRRRASRRVAP